MPDSPTTTAAPPMSRIMEEDIARLYGDVYARLVMVFFGKSSISVGNRLELQSVVRSAMTRPVPFVVAAILAVSAFSTVPATAQDRHARQPSSHARATGERAVPNRAVPRDVAPSVVAPRAVAPRAVAPAVVVPRAVPRAVAPRVVRPQVVRPYYGGAYYARPYYARP